MSRTRHVTIRYRCDACGTSCFVYDRVLAEHDEEPVVTIPGGWAAIAWAGRARHACSAPCAREVLDALGSERATS